MHNTQQRHSGTKFNQKLFTLNKKHPTLIEHFKVGKHGKSSSSKPEDKTNSEAVRYGKMTKVNLRAAISRRFKAVIAEKVVSKFPEFQNAQEFEQFCDIIEKALNQDNDDRLWKIAFEIFDFNQDRVVCELDTYTLLQTFQDDDEVFLAAFSNDLCVLGAALEKKR